MAKKNTPLAELVPMDTLAAYEHNPRDNSGAVASVMASIKEFGFLVPIVVNGDGTILAGHTRFEAAKRLGMTEVPVLWATHLTKEQQDAFRIIDNKTAELAKWDFDLLAQEVANLKETGIDLLPYGWSQQELDCLSDMVAEDCLSGTLPEDAPHDGGLEVRAAQGGCDGVNSVIQTNKGQNVVSRDPTSVRFAFGEINFYVNIDHYQDWAHNIRKENGFDMDRVIADLARRVGVQAKTNSVKSDKEKEQDALAMREAKEAEALRSGKSRAEVNADAATTRAKLKTAGKTLKRITKPITKAPIAAE